MSEWSSSLQGIVDGHVHMGGIAEEPRLLEIRKATGIEKMALVSIQDPASGAGLAQSLSMKARHHGVFYVFAGLNHGTRLSDGRVHAPSLVEQVDAFAAMGCDGIKMIESKPDSRRRLNVPLTDAYYADYWARVEELGLPLVWHVNDPEEFWDPERIPSWAKKENWGYGPSDVQKEQLYKEVDAVLDRHPRLRVIFAHFYFLSADLPRAARFFDKHPTVHFDLTPGVEMLYNMSRAPEATREFFTRYADRIVYGTDLFSNLSVDEGRYRAGLVFRWLERSDVFRVPAGADFLLGPPEDGIIRGLSLPTGLLTSIYRTNFTRLAGPEPRALNVGLAVEACNRIATIAQAMSGKAGGPDGGRAGC